MFVCVKFSSPAVLHLITVCQCNQSMASTLKASSTIPTLVKGSFFQDSPHKSHIRRICRLDCSDRRVIVQGSRWKRPSSERTAVACISTAGELGSLVEKEEEEEEEEQQKEKSEEGRDEYLVREFRWGVRRMAQVGEEIRMVAYVQAEAFHEPVALFNDVLFEFFKAEVLSALMCRLRNSPPDRYACLIAEEAAPSPPKSARDPVDGIVGVVDVTVLRDDDVMRHLPAGEEEYLYVSGIAVLSEFRRQKVGTALLKACDALSEQWGFKYLVLRAYEDDGAARTLYARAGYRVVSRDPLWMTWTGNKRRVLMVKQSHPVVNKM